MNNFAVPESEPIHPVTVRRHRVDWEADDLDDITARRALALGTELQRGCWYLNPRFTVSSPAPTPEFYRTVLHLRSAWLRTCRQVQGRSGQRGLARRAEREGRRGAVLMIDPGIATTPPTLGSPGPIPLQNLPAAHRPDILQAGHLAKNLTFSGVLFIDGELIPPRTWQAMADEGKEPPLRS